jgi:uncharacterized protein (TIGR03083 family)
VPLQPLSPTDTRHFFRPLSAEFVALLRDLPADAWEKRTVAREWRVRDVVAHLLDGAIRRISFHRDRHQPPAPPQQIASERDFVAFINGLNAQWIAAANRISPRVLTDLYAWASEELAAFFESQSMDAPALFAVSWAGESTSAGWFDVGRELTEVWHHQQQVRDAVGGTPASEPAWLHAVLEIAVRGLPHAYSQVPTRSGDTLAIRIHGDAGGTWTLRRDDDRWSIWAGEPTAPTSRIQMSDGTAWRILFNAFDESDVARSLQVTGDAALAEPLLQARSVIV